MPTKILIIEDDPIILQNTLQILKLEGFEVLGADNGLSGLEAIHSELPDLVLSDISMPGLSGHEVLAKMREDVATATIPFIFLTAYSAKSDLRQGMEAGADDYLTKPFTVPELLMAINARLERHIIFKQAQDRKLNELRGNIIYLLPHELRTPLVAVLGYADFLIDNFGTLDQKTLLKGLERIRVGGQRLSRLIENYLLYAQIEVFKSDANQQVVLRSYVVDSPANFIRQTAQVKAKQVSREADVVFELADVPSIHISEESLKKMVEEVLDNAIKFSAPGTPIDVKSTADSDVYVVSICNRGRGLSATQIADVGAYMQFQRKLYEQQGSGLGLSIVRGLLDLHGGHMAIESIPDETTTLSLMFPISTPRS